MDQIDALGGKRPAVAVKVFEFHHLLDILGYIRLFAAEELDDGVLEKIANVVVRGFVVLAAAEER